MYSDLAVDQSEVKIEVLAGDAPAASLLLDIDDT